MTVKLKKLADQVMVITGASSGIGLVTARMAAKRGAKLVLAARSEDALRSLTDELASTGAESIHVVADVSSEADVRRIAEEAVRRFGGFDTWVNNAGVSIYGKLTKVATEDSRALFDTNFWGTVFGSQAAVEHFKNRNDDYGRALINVGSTLSDRAIPIQGMYCASKHAVKGFTDALRMELEMENLPVSVTLVKPAAIDTPYKEHAKNYMSEEPENPPPVYAPEVVAEAILHCAENPVRDLFAGGGGKGLSMLGEYAPRLTDKVMAATLGKIQRSGRPALHQGEDRGLMNPSGEVTGGLKERGGYTGHVMESSLYTKASLHPVMTGALLLGAGLGIAALIAANNKRKPKGSGFDEREHRSEGRRNRTQYPLGERT